MLEASIEELYRIAQAAWPDVQLLPATFIRHVAERIPAAQPILPSIKQVYASDLYLACACLQGNHRALVLLDEHYLQPIPAFIVGSKSGPVSVDEISQMLREKLLVATPTRRAKLADYGGRGTLTAWIRVAAMRVATDLHRQSHPLRAETAEQLAAQVMQTSPSPELACIKSRYQSTLIDALRVALSSLSDEENNLIWLYYLNEQSMEAIARLFGVNRSTIKRRIDDVRGRLLQHTKRYLRQHLHISSAEFHSLVKLLLSQLDLTVAATGS